MYVAPLASCEIANLILILNFKMNFQIGFEIEFNIELEFESEFKVELDIEVESEFEIQFDFESESEFNACMESVFWFSVWHHENFENHIDNLKICY